MAFNQEPPARLPASPTPYKLNRDQSVAVALGVYWNPDMSTCPRGTKVQLKGKAGVAHYYNYDGDPFWVAWAPLPRDLPHDSTTR